MPASASADLLADSARRHQTALGRAFQRTVTLSGRIYTMALTERTTAIEDGRGGFRQGRRAFATILCSQLADSVLFDATTGVLKRQTLTVGGTDYRIKAAMKDPQRVLWTLELTEAVA